MASSSSYIARSPEERATIWKGRKSAFSAVGRLSPDFIVQDGVVPRGKLGLALRRIGEMAGEHGLRVANVFHAGDGNLHPLILYDGQQPGQFENAERLAGRILDLCIEHGGSITGEHGVGIEKINQMCSQFSRAELAMAVEAGVGTIVLDNADEARRLSELLGGREQRVLLRVTPGVDADTHEAIWS